MNIKYILTLILFFLHYITFAQVNNLEKTVTDIAQNTNFSNAMVSVAVYDSKTGEKIYGLNDHFSIATASTTKLFSTAAAISLLGDKQLETRFYIDGEVKDSILYGNIWIRGGGDPTLGSKYTTSKTVESRDFLKVWSDSIRAKGITKITGAIIGDASEFGYKGCPDGWSWSDIGNAYGAYPSGLSIFDNVLTFRMQTGVWGTPATVTKMTPEVPGLKFFNYITAANVTGDNSYIYGAPYQNERIGIGTLQKSTMITIRGSLPDPEFQVAYEFKNTLQQAGITISDSVVCARNLLFENKLDKNRYSQFPLLFTYKGATISQIINWTNMHSVNMFAEQLTCLLGYYKNGDGSHDNGMKEEAIFWQKSIPSKGLFLMDGSGLSRSNALSVSHLCSLLNFMYKSTNYTSFYSSLPVTGESGTLSDVCKNQLAHGKIHAKSGTMRRIKSYAGYATTTSGRELSFAIVLNNYNCTNYQAKLYVQKFMNVLVTLQ
jgi:serine-type D-Ala-D-Ala carboxypeptidase/endopeptidase (penicillin-binding protein 4)